TLSRGELFHFTPELGFNASFTNLLVCVREYVPAVSSGRASALFGTSSSGVGAQRGSSLMSGSNNSCSNPSSFFVVSQVPELTRTLVRSNTAPMCSGEYVV
ncbi:Ankyrin-like protein, partial [Globisporangium polare]